MSGSKLFSGPPSNKATASTLAAAVSTLFWTIAAHTFLKTMSTADLALYVTTSTVILTAVIGFAVPESAAFTAHNQQRLAAVAAAKSSTATSPAIGSAIEDLGTRLEGIQELQNMIAARMGLISDPTIPASKE